MHVTIPYSSGTVETVVTLDGSLDLLVPVYPSSGEIANPGEMAISTLDGYEAICIKSDRNENVLFSDDAANQAKLSSWYNSADGGLALAQNNDNGPVLSLSEGVPLNNQTIMELKNNPRLTLGLADYEGKVDGNGYSLTPFKDSERCVIYNYETDFPDNLSEMKDIRFNVLPDNASTSCEITINNGSDIRTLPNGRALLCDCVHGLENLEPVYDFHIDHGQTPVYCIKQRFDSDITASFADSSQTGCYAVASHAEGSNSTTFTVGSHAEGFNTSVGGKFSHSEGSVSNALGPCSSAHNNQTTTDSAAIASSVYGYMNGVSHVGEFACGQSNILSSGMLFSVGDGICIDQGDITPTPMFLTPQCTPHNVFKILSGGTSDNTYYYPLFGLNSTKSNIVRNMVIKATVTVNNQPTTLTKTLGEWYEFLINGGN